MLMSDIRRLDDEQLKLEADSLQRKLFEMRSQKATAKNRGHQCDAANTP